jgi:hypothetical protein
MSTLAVNSVTDANGGNTATINSMTPTADSLQGFRNRIINGDMRLNQRGWTSAAVTDAYTVDRWYVGEQTDGAITAEQSTDAPAGFINSLKITVTSTDTSLSATQYSICRQIIEGTNVADLGWGAAGAKTVTVSFWVRSSLTGTFGGSLVNDGFNRSYPFTYSISAANTWEQKSVTIAGDTSGTWLTTTGRGIRVHFSLGSGSDYTGTAGAWAASGLFGATGETNLLATNGATWQFTGVQLEVGSVATPFERRPFGQELALCQRYYQPIFYSYEGNMGTAGTATPHTPVLSVPMRAAGTVTSTTVTSGNAVTGLNNALINTRNGLFNTVQIVLNFSGSGYGYYQADVTCNSEL